MHCAACHADYPSTFEQCPRCHTPSTSTPAASPAVAESVPALAPASEHRTKQPAPTSASAASGDAAVTTAPIAPTASTLIEFPGKGRAPKPQWRKELSERVREIQQRRALEAAHETEEATYRQARPQVLQNTAENSAPPLGLVPSVNAPEMNPLVAAALKRIERARQPPPVSRGARRGAAAAARVAEESFEEAVDSLAVAPAPALPAPLLEVPAAAGLESSQQSEGTEPEKIEMVTGQTEAPRTTTTLIAVPLADKLPQVEAVPAAKPPSRRVANVVIDDNYLARKEAEDAVGRASAPTVDDRAPFGRRLAAGALDLIIISFISSPSAAIIEITNGNWTDLRVVSSFAGVVLTVMFLYLMVTTAAFGRTWSQWLLSLHTVDARNGLIPTAGQCARRAFVFMLSLAAAGLPLVYAFIDAEGRAAHDHFSGTIVVRD